MKKIIAIFGVSGFSREIIPIINKMIVDDKLKNVQEVLLVDKHQNENETIFCGKRVVSLDEIKILRNDYSIEFVIAIADSKIREKVANENIDLGLIPLSIIVENVTIYDDVDIEIGSIICANSILTANITIGKFFHCNIMSYVAHDCTIGDFVTFAPGVKCNGNVVIKDHAYIGTGAILKQGSPESPLVIGEGAVIGMGAVVTKNVEPHTVVIGNPAKLMKPKNLI